MDTTSQETGQVVDPVQDMFSVVEGSALIPFMEVSEYTHRDLSKKCILSAGASLNKSPKMIPQNLLFPNIHTLITVLINRLTDNHRR